MKSRYILDVTEFEIKPAMWQEEVEFAVTEDAVVISILREDGVAIDTTEVELKYFKEMCRRILA